LPGTARRSAVFAAPVTTVVATIHAVLKRIVPSVIVLAASLTGIGLPRCSGDSPATRLASWQLSAPSVRRVHKNAKEQLDNEPRGLGGRGAGINNAQRGHLHAIRPAAQSGRARPGRRMLPMWRTTRDHEEPPRGGGRQLGVWRRRRAQAETRTARSSSTGGKERAELATDRIAPAQRVAIAAEGPAIECRRSSSWAPPAVRLMAMRVMPLHPTDLPVRMHRLRLAGSHEAPQ